MEARFMHVSQSYLQDKGITFHLMHFLDRRISIGENHYFSVYCTISHRGVQAFFLSPFAAQE